MQAARKKQTAPKQKRVQYVTLEQLMSIVQPDQKDLLEMEIQAEIDLKEDKKLNLI